MRRPSSIRATQNGGPKPYLDLLSLSAPESNSLADALALNKQAPTTRDRETGILNVPQRLDASALPKQMQNAYGRPAPHEFQFPLAGKRRLSGAAAARMRPDEGAAAGLRVRPPLRGDGTAGPGATLRRVRNPRHRKNKALADRPATNWRPPFSPENKESRL